MTLIQQIKNDQLTARKNREAVKASLLTTLIGEASIVGKNDGNRESTDAEVVAVIKKFVKNTNELIAAYGPIEGGPVLQPLAELAILQGYLPKQLTEDQLKVIVGELKAEVGATNAKDMGKVMTALKAKYDGQYDGKVASQLIKVALS